MAGLAAHPHRAAVAFASFGGDQAVEDLRCGPGEFFEGGPHCLATSSSRVRSRAAARM